MSADNYMRVRKVPDGGYCVTNESMSAAEEGPVEDTLALMARGRGQFFETLDEAVAYANSEYSEYGISFDFPTRTVEA